MYGCETWTLTQKAETKLLVTYLRILRNILGPVQRDEGSWYVRKNKEVDRLFCEPNILGERKALELGWFRHVVRMEQDMPAGVPEGLRPLRRPTCRWSDAVEGYLRELQVSDW